MNTQYKGVPFFKSPFDMGIYLQLLSKQKPRTIIEIGTKFGGSALWFADLLGASGVAAPKVISVDIAPQTEFVDDRIEFLIGDAANLETVLPVERLKQLPGPLLVIEDSSHYYEHSLAVLNHFHPVLQSGDYIVVEDGVVSQFHEAAYHKYQGGPNRAVADFLSKHPEDYEIDLTLCDHYGQNFTYNPNGYLKRK